MQVLILFELLTAILGAAVNTYKTLKGGISAMKEMRQAPQKQFFSG